MNPCESLQSSPIPPPSYTRQIQPKTPCEPLLSSPIPTPSPAIPDKSVDPRSECLEPSNGGRFTSPTPLRWTPPLGPFAGLRGFGGETPKPNHLSGRSMQKPRTPTQVLPGVTCATLGDLVSGLRALAAGLRCFESGLQTLKTRLRGFGPQSSKPSRPI